MNDDQWTPERIEGFRVTSPDTDEVNWPRDTIRAYVAAQEPVDLPANVKAGTVALENAPATATMRHEAAEIWKGIVAKPPLIERDPDLHPWGPGHERAIARQFAPDGGPNPEPSKALHPDRRPVFERVTDRADAQAAARVELDEMETGAQGRIKRNIARFMNRGADPTEGVRVGSGIGSDVYGSYAEFTGSHERYFITGLSVPGLPDPTGTVFCIGLGEVGAEIAVAELSLGHTNTIRLARQIEVSPQTRVSVRVADPGIRERDYIVQLRTVERLASGGTVDPTPLLEQPEPSPPGLIRPDSGFSPAMTGPYRGGKTSRFRLKWSTALVWTLLIVGSVMSAGLVYLIANWVY